MVVGERDTDHGAPMNVEAQAAFNKVSGLQVRMGNEFEKQFNSEDLSRIFPLALNYSFGGADVQDFFSTCEDLTDENYSTKNTARVRRTAGAPRLDPGAYAQMLATRC